MAAEQRPGRAIDVFLAFARLGLTAFGGPVAHVGYFRDEFVARRQWVDERGFARLLAICQFLPGPASSQLGFAIGLQRAGWRGGLAAFAGFTLPSALLMWAFARVATFGVAGYGAAAVHGLKVVAVAIVAHALIGMARTLAPDALRRCIAVGALVLIVLDASPWMQIVAIGLGACVGAGLSRQVVALASDEVVIGRRRGTPWLAFGLYAAGLAFALLSPHDALSAGSVFAAFYRTGALVFGGGHVVLPLLQETVVAPGWLPAADFLSGYGAAQAMPGPMFSLAAFLGARLALPYPSAVGAAIALAGIFLPGFLLLAGALPVWSRMASRPAVARAMAGANAAVVGVLAAAFYDPVCTQGVRNAIDGAVALIAFVLVSRLRRGALVAVGWCVAAELAAAAMWMA